MPVRSGSRVSEASSTGSPSTPVAAATASRKAVSRCSSSSYCAGVATPSMTAIVRPSAKSERNGTWSGSSWISRMASSSEGTPASSRVAMRAAPLAGDAVHDLTELPEDVRFVGAERDLQPAFPDLAARADVLLPGPRIAERDEGAWVLRQPQALGQRAADPAFRAARGLQRIWRRNRGSARSSRRTACGRGPARRSRSAPFE